MKIDNFLVVLFIICLIACIIIYENREKEYKQKIDLIQIKLDSIEKNVPDTVYYLKSVIYPKM